MTFSVRLVAALALFASACGGLPPPPCRGPITSELTPPAETLPRRCAIVEPDDGCFLSACGTSCSEQPSFGTCVADVSAEGSCLMRARCERQRSGQCGFSPTPASIACFANLTDAGVIGRDAGVAPRDAGAGACYRGGCSSQLCSDQPGLGSTCEWREEYACYQQATCERQRDGRCGFTPTPALSACLAPTRDAGTPVRDAGVGACYRGGCSNQLCSDQPGLISTCEWREEYACYQAAACERQPDGQCGFTPSPALAACLAPADAGTPVADAGVSRQCYRGGCSGQLCSDQQGVASTCEWRPQYACYQAAACEVQPNGQCGFTPTAALAACLRSPP